MPERIRLGIIGLGAMGREMLEVAWEHPDVQVVACADQDAGRLSLAAADFPGLRLTPDGASIVGAADVDAIYIAVPPAAHARFAIPALEAGKAVFCEKPLAVDLVEAEAMASLAARTGVVNAINFALADRHAVLEMERALRAGELGTLRQIEIRLTFPQWPRAFQVEATWLADRRQGGFVREVFSHFAYLADRLAGPLVPAFTRLEAAGAGSETSAFGLFHAGGIPVLVTGLADATVEERYDFLLCGSNRSYRFLDWGELSAFEGGAWAPVPLQSPRGTEHTRLSDFARAIRGGPRTLPDFETGLRVARAVEAFHQAG